MPETFSTQYRGAREEIHAWYVYPNDRDLDRPNPAAKVFEVVFNREYPRWSCSCFSGFQFPGSYICDHARAVFSDITRRKGPWEGDEVLMGAAWNALQTNREQLEVQYRGSSFGSLLWHVAPGENPAGYYEVYIEPQERRWVCTCKPNDEQNLNEFACPHAVAVFQEVAKKNVSGSWKQDKQFMELASQFLLDRTRSRMYAQGGKVSKNYYDKIMKNIPSYFYGYDTATGKDTSNSTYSTSASPSESSILSIEDLIAAIDKSKKEKPSKIYGLKADSLTIDELNGSLEIDVTKDAQEPKIARTRPAKPEEPKKPKSRFSEIDL